MITLGLRDALPAGEAPPAPEMQAKTVLIVDDDPASLTLMREALAGEPYRIETADTARSAIVKLSSLSGDLILLDLQVPFTNGTRLSSRLLGDDGLASIPIIALTAADGSLRGNPGSGGRFDGYIGKPVNRETFAAQVRTILECSGKRQRNSCGPSLSFTPARDLRKQAADLLDAIEQGLPDAQFAPGTETGLCRLAAVVGGLQHCALADYVHRAERLSRADTARGRSRFRSLIRLCRELVDREPDTVPGLAALRDVYLENRRGDLEDLDHALKNGDLAALCIYGHNLKGTGATYGFTELSEIGKALEKAAGEGDGVAVEVLLEQLDAYVGIVLPSPYRGDVAGDRNPDPLMAGG